MKLTNIVDLVNPEKLFFIGNRNFEVSFQFVAHYEEEVKDLAFVIEGLHGEKFHRVDLGNEEIGDPEVTE